MADLVASFNQLSRPGRTPSGLASNHWYFAIRHVPLEPTNDLVQIVNPDSYYTICSDAKQILSLPNITAQADVIATALLETFVKGIDRGSEGRPNPQISPFAPFTWGTRNSELARAVETKLRALGVREELCTVLSGSKQQDEVADERWKTMMNGLMKSMGETLPQEASPGRTICSGCKKDSSWFSAGLLKCAGCGREFYCSRDCQKKDWKEHKKACGNTGVSSTSQQSSSTSGQALDLEYYQEIAHTVPEAKVLADSISLSLPQKIGGVNKAIRRLILTGKDTPQNFEILFGPKWQSITRDWNKSRIDILLEPPPGSPSYTFHLANDEGSIERNLRPASEKEAAKIQTIRGIQQAIRARLGTRTQPTTEDMVALLPTFGANWATMLPDYELAVNTMDQGAAVRNVLL